MSAQINPCGWFGSIHTFLSLPKQDWFTALYEHHQHCMNCPADENQQAAWNHSFDLLQMELKKLVQSSPAAGNFTIIFEYELPPHENVEVMGRPLPREDHGLLVISRAKNLHM